MNTKIILDKWKSSRGVAIYVTTVSQVTSWAEKNLI